MPGVRGDGDGPGEAEGRSAALDGHPGRAEAGEGGDGGQRARAAVTGPRQRAGAPPDGPDHGPRVRGRTEHGAEGRRPWLLEVGRLLARRDRIPEYHETQHTIMKTH